MRRRVAHPDPVVQYAPEAAMITRDQVIDVLKTCFDPEIPVNIWDLGLIYDITVTGDVVNIKMTLTAVGCSLGPQLVSEIESKLLGLDGIEDAKVEMVWNPPWTPERLSDDGRLSLQAMGFPV
jgi:metal-sulfur cluster biosynthetic enzyme